MKIALITGITGQDGSYLAELLLEKGYEVHGVIRRSSLINTHRIDHIYNRIKLHYGDLTDSTNLVRVIQQVQPDEIYNLGAQSHVKVSFEMPEYTGMVDGLGTLRVLEAVRLLGMENKVRIYQASTSEMYGDTPGPQNENTLFSPISPYACAKVFAHNLTATYRKSYDMFACSGILFNHESPRRGEHFVTRKITKAAANILAGKQDKLELGRIDTKRDWGFAGDYVEAMWLMLQQDKPDDYVIATGEHYSVRDFIEEASPYFGMFIEWKGKGLDEIGVDKRTGKVIVRVDPKYFRPSEVDSLLGDASKAKNVLGWKPKHTFKQLVEDMCIHGQ